MTTTPATAGQEDWFTLTLNDVIPMWGEGATRAEAIVDLLESITELRRDIIGEPDARLSSELQEQRDFLRAIEAEAAQGHSERDAITTDQVWQQGYAAGRATQGRADEGLLRQAAEYALRAMRIQGWHENGAPSMATAEAKLRAALEAAATPAASHPHDGYAYDGCRCVCCMNVRALASATRPQGRADEGLREALAGALDQAWPLNGAAGGPWVVERDAIYTALEAAATPAATPDEGLEMALHRAAYNCPAAIPAESGEHWADHEEDAQHIRDGWALAEPQSDGRRGYDGYAATPPEDGLDDWLHWKHGACVHGNPCSEHMCPEYGRWERPTGGTAPRSLSVRSPSLALHGRVPRRGECGPGTSCPSRRHPTGPGGQGMIPSGADFWVTRRREDREVLERLARELDGLADQTDATGRSEGPGLRADARTLRRIAADMGHTLTISTALATPQARVEDRDLDSPEAASTECPGCGATVGFDGRPRHHVGCPQAPEAADHAE